MGQLCSVYRLAVDQLTHAPKPDHDGESLELRVANRPALRVDVAREDHPPGWAAGLASMTGYPFEHLTRSASAALLIDLGDARYALAFGPTGRHLLRPEAIQPDFGVAIALRCLDPEQVLRVARTELGTAGRHDLTEMPSGSHLRSFGVDRYREIVKKVAGRSDRLEIAQLRRSGTVRLDGSDSLQIRVAKSPDGLVADLTAIETAYQREPHPELAFIEGLRPVIGADRDGARRALAAELGDPGSDRIGLAVPFDVDTAAITSVTVTAGREEISGDQPDLAMIASVLRRLPESRRIEALQRGRVWLSGPDAPEPVETVLGRWLAADLAVGEDRYVFHDGAFYRMTDEFRQTLAGNVQELLRRSGGLALPRWPLGTSEEAYCQEVAERDGFTLLDRKLVRDNVHRRQGVEIGDLLGPGGELICVKRAAGSSLLSHLFTQALVAADALADGDRAYQKLLEHLPEQRRGDLARRPGFVFAIQLTKKDKKGRKRVAKLTPDSLFSFSQVALHRAAQHLNRLAMNVSIVSIDAE